MHKQLMKEIRNLAITIGSAIMISFFTWMGATLIDHSSRLRVVEVVQEDNREEIAALRDRTSLIESKL